MFRLRNICSTIVSWQNVSKSFLILEIVFEGYSTRASGRFFFLGEGEFLRKGDILISSTRWKIVLENGGNIPCWPNFFYFLIRRISGKLQYFLYSSFTPFVIIISINCVSVLNRITFFFKFWMLRFLFFKANQNRIVFL